jgi:hypothetical protein
VPHDALRLGNCYCRRSQCSVSSASGVGANAARRSANGRRRRLRGRQPLDRSAALVRAGGTLVTIARIPTVQPKGGRAIFFVVEPDRTRLADLAQRLRDGRLKPIVGAVRPLAEATTAFAPDRRTPGKTIIRVTESE